MLDVCDLHDEAFAVDMFRSCESVASLLTSNDPDRQAIGAGFLRGGEWKCEEGVLIVFTDLAAAVGIDQTAAVRILGRTLLCWKAHCSLNPLGPLPKS